MVFCCVVELVEVAATMIYVMPLMCMSIEEGETQVAEDSRLALLQPSVLLKGSS